MIRANAVSRSVRLRRRAGAPQRAVTEIRRMLRAWRQYQPDALITMVEKILEAHGLLTERDHVAVGERHGQWYTDPNTDDTTAYDGSIEPQKRDLTAREREIVGRVLRDVLRSGQRIGDREPHAKGLAALFADEIAGTAMVARDEVPLLNDVVFVINPRNDWWLNRA